MSDLTLGSRGLDERWIEPRSPDAEPSDMTDPLVHCAGCARGWHSKTMADGLRLIGSCPRCGGVLVYADAAPAPIPTEQAASEDGLAPHLVLGVPRR